jgi:membrane fusion protein (multidrug efflux system)
MKTLLKLLVSLLIVLILIALSVWYWHDSHYYPSTDDAYVNANVINISTQVTGRVNHMNITNNQFVKKGELLFTLDPAPFEYNVRQARAQVALALQQAEADADAVNVAKATLAERHAELKNAEVTYDRYAPLIDSGTEPDTKGDDITSQLLTARAEVNVAKSQLQQAISQLGADGADNANVKLAQAELDSAEYQLANTVIYAPADGTITNCSLRAGSVVTANTALFALIEQANSWIDANFKETELTHLRVGLPATMTIDMYPDHTFTGKIESISRGSGAAFSLLPPENASGNWIKISQRFPVKIVFSNIGNDTPLRVGASATVRIDTTGRS